MGKFIAFSSGARSALVRISPYAADRSALLPSGLEDTYLRRRPGWTGVVGRGHGPSCLADWPAAYWLFPKAKATSAFPAPVPVATATNCRPARVR
jgi:hypothetical protein